MASLTAEVDAFPSMSFGFVKGVVEAIPEVMTT